MKFFNFLGIFLFTMCFSLTAQTDTIDCDAKADTAYLKTLPWYGNNTYLQNFLDSIGYPSPSSRIVGTDRVRYRIPIKFWIYRSNAGTGGPTIAQLQSYIDNLNRLYNVDNNTLIGFYMRCNVSYVNTTSSGAVNLSFIDAGLTAQNNKERGCINIHIVDGLPDMTSGVQIRARFFGIDGIFLANSTYNPAFTGFFASTIAHEVGHYLQLEHTHEGNDSWIIRREAISRTRTWSNGKKVCQTTGDLLEDTPADPLLNANNFCTYSNVAKTDLWGDSYASPPAGSSSPDPTNILSYNGLRTCRNHFSRQQIAVMLHSIERGKSKGNKTGWKDLKGEYDEYEFDNDITTARLIQLGEIQERNFHQQYTSETVLGGTPVWTNCDVDWIRYTALCSGTFPIETSAMPGRLNANTRITLFNATGTTQLGQNDNISGTNLFSKLSYTFSPGTTYLIRVENMAPPENSYYKIAIGVPKINGNNVVCTSSTYTIENLPISAAVNWSALPTGFVTLNPGPAGSVTITRVGTLTGNVTLNATYTCGSFVSASLVVSIGTPPLSITSTRNGCSGQYQQWNIINNTPTNGSNWSWSVGNLGTNSQITIFSQSSPSTALSVKGGGAVRLNYTDLCSAARTDGVTVYSTCGGSFSVVVSPNPAQDNINLSFTQPDDGKTSIVAKTSAIPLQIIKSKGKTIMSLFEVSTNMLVKQWKYNESKSSNYSLNVNGLRKGVYVLQVDRDDLSEMIKILIE